MPSGSEAGSTTWQSTRYSATFDESEYGFSRLSDLLRALPGVAGIISNPRGDITVVAARSAGSPARNGAPLASVSQQRNREKKDPARELANAAGLSRYGFDSNARNRRRVLSDLFPAMKVEELFAIADVVGRKLQENESHGLSI